MPLTTVPAASDIPALVCCLIIVFAQVLKAHCLKERKAGKKKKKKEVGCSLSFAFYEHNQMCIRMETGEAVHPSLPAQTYKCKNLG